ncbi:hypothetical protein MKZ20_17475 [Psychrobacillus sp. FSL K6-2684]|uniref:hypothetical protein n=1 Tax=Psychrobacillus sp. FSL K6-2684 TaxID=2921547 RepID=UPI0030F70029
MGVQQILIEQTINYIDSLVHSAKLVIDGMEVSKNIYKTVKNGAELKKYVYLENETGTITKAALIDANGRELVTREAQFEKGPDGFMIVFPFTLKVEEGI